MKTTGTKKTRGYVLLEAVIGGALSAAVLGAILTNIGDARSKSVVAAREATAAQLVFDKLEEKRAEGFAAVSAENEPRVVGLNMPYERITTVAAGTQTVGTATLNVKTVTVSVTFTPAATPIVKTASVKIYP